MRRMTARGHGGHQAIRRPLKKGLLIAPKAHWPRFDGGLSMETAGFEADGRQIFRYEHSVAYSAVQAAFEDCQATFDPANIAALLQNYPYHIDSLMTMFDLYRVRT